MRGGTDFSMATKIAATRRARPSTATTSFSAEDIEAAITRTADYVVSLRTERNVVEHAQNALIRAVAPQAGNLPLNNLAR